MRKAPVFGNAPGFKPMGMAPVFGEPVYEILIQTDARGLMKTTITRYPVGNPPSQLEMIGVLLDCIQGQYQGMVQAASLLIDPNRKEIPSNGGQEKENDNGCGGDSSGSNGT